eukprot:Tamp_07927.p1 GENE.Tamp_07927~~Tamp_07927.p1  ORF type:complete len:621 (-),score=64.16 Tamp_07927:218-2080(-)
MRCGSSARVANDDVSLASMPSLRIGTVHDATGADTTTEWYEDTGLKISHTNAARAGSDGEEVAEGVLSERANRAAFVARVAPPRGFLFKSGVMLAIGIAGASPRALVLLLSRCVPSVSVAQALSDFPALWAPCAKEGATFSAHSPGGSLFTYLIATDGVLKSGFMLLAYVAALDAVTFFGGARSRGRNRGVRRCAALMSALLFVAPLVLDTCHWILPHTIEPAYAMDARDASFTAIYVLLVLLMAGIDARQLIAPSTSPAMPKALVVRAVMLRARVVGLLAVQIAFCVLVNQIQSNLANLFLGTWWQYSYILPVIVNKFGLTLLRNAVLDDATSPKELQALMSFASNVHVSMTSRRAIAYHTNNDSLSTFVFNTFVLALVELATRIAVYAGYVWRGSRYMSKLNFKTMSEHGGLLDAGQTAARARILLMMTLLADQFSELCVCVLIALQDATLPVWTQYSVWRSYDEYVARGTRVLAIFGIQMLIEMAVDWLVYTWIYKILEGGEACTFMKVFVRNRSMVVFAICIVAHMSIAFWPKCLRCDDPMGCLLFTECLRSGVVDINGDNYCTTYPRNMTNIGNITLAVSRPWTNVSFNDLGCTSGTSDARVEKLIAVSREGGGW